MLPPMAFRPALVRTTRCPEGDAINGARTQGDATAIAAARPEPRSKLRVRRRYVSERNNYIHRGQAVVVVASVHSCFVWFYNDTSSGYKHGKQSAQINAQNKMPGVRLVRSLCGPGLGIPTGWCTSHAQKKETTVVVLDPSSRFACTDFASVYILNLLRKSARNEIGSLD